VQGTCACAAGKTRCGTRCVDLRYDEPNCCEYGRTCARCQVPRRLVRVSEHLSPRANTRSGRVRMPPLRQPR